MIIKNNFNEKNANPLSNYQSIGSGRDTLDNYEKNDESKKIIQDIINHDHEYDDSEEEEKDKWSFFK